MKTKKDINAMKKLSFLLIFLTLCMHPFAQTVISLGRAADQIKTLEDNVTRLHVEFDYASLQANTVETKQGQFAELLLEGGLFDGAVGTPKLPISQQLIEIPFGAVPEVKILRYTTQEFDLADFGIAKLVPMQAPVSKNDLPEDMPFAYDETSYAIDDYVGQTLAEVHVMGILRSYHIAKLTVAPVRYNPVRNKIQVFNDVELEIRFPGADLELTNEIKAKTRSPYFDVVHEAFLNQGLERDYPGHPDLTRYPIKYVIVADRMFDGLLDDFIEWKTQKGFHVTMAYTDEIGNTFGAIQAYLHGLYNSATVDDPAPSFILFAGDTQQIPASIGPSSQKVTDLYYASVDGDYFPDMYYGRFSAQTGQQLINQIEKTLYYERYQFVDPAYLNRTTLIAGWDSYWTHQIGHPTLHYGMDNWFNDDHGYSDVYPYWGPDDYPGCYEDDKISVSMINYTAHCSETVWGTPSLTSSDINQMHNEGFYPLAIGNCCESSQFAYGECVGETWARAEKKGAVCYLGSAPSTYWYEDAWWAMGAYHITGANLGQTPTYEQTSMGSYDAMHEGGYVSTGGLVLCGNMAVTEACNHSWSDAAQYYWEAYNVLGDPSLVCYHTQGTDNVVSHEPTLFRGFGSFSVDAEPGSYVGLSKDGVLLGSGMVGESGELTLAITPVEEGGFANLVVTKPQRIPYRTTIPVATAGQPYLVVTSVTPEYFDYNKETNLSITVTNVGDNEIPANTTVDLQTVDERILVLESQCIVDQPIPVGGTRVIDDAFQVKAAPEIADGETFRLITLANCGDQVNSDFYVTIGKPVFEAVGYEWDGSFIPGASFEIWATFKNIGGAAAEMPVGYIASDNEALSFPQADIPMARIDVGETATCRFVVEVAESASIYEALNLEMTLLDAGVSLSQHVTLYNRCTLHVELHDAGGNGWEGAAVRVNFEDGTEPLRIELLEGAFATQEVVSRKGYKIKLSWLAGSNDGECSFSMRYDDGTLFYESGANLHGTLLLAPVDCEIHSVDVAEAEAAPVLVYPNPTSGQLHVVSSNPISRCCLLNSFRQLVLEQQALGKELSLNVAGLSPGLYLLRVTAGDEETVHKIMIK